MHQRNISALVCAAASIAAGQVGLAPIEGTIPARGVNDNVIIQRDAQGIVTIKAARGADALFALGFAHGQDRYFQMDSMRRFAAGEVSELAGPIILESDKAMRVLDLRTTANESVRALSPENRVLLDSYVAGVNAGYATLPAPPPEYALMGATPAPWTAEDSALVMFAFASQLQGGAQGWKEDRAHGVMKDTLNPAVYDFVTSRLHPMDVPLFGGRDVNLVPIPTKEQFESKVGAKPLTNFEALLIRDEYYVGSNNFAVDATRTKNGRAIACGDPHLLLQAPNVWYRARIEVTQNNQQVAITGVSSPGIPAIIMGSMNISKDGVSDAKQQFAWTMTNVQADLIDAIIIQEKEPGKTYVTPDGVREYEAVKMSVKVKGSSAVDLNVKRTIWGPIVGTDHLNRPLAFAWMAQRPGAFSFDTLTVMDSPPKSMAEALDYLVIAIDPTQNCVVACGDGSIGYVLTGAYPLRVGYTGQYPVSFADGACKWDGLRWPVGSTSRPYVLRATGDLDGVLATANNRVWDQKNSDYIGFSGDNPFRAARADEILRSRKDWTEKDLQAVALDTRVRRYDLFRDIIVQSTSPALAPAREAAKGWNGRADADQKGYRIVRRFAQRVREAINVMLLSPATARAEKAGFDLDFIIGDYPVRALIEARPAHLLPRHINKIGSAAPVETWDEFFDAMLDVASKDLTSSKAGFDAPWGKVNMSAIHHPVGGAIPGPLGSGFNFPAHAQSGDGPALRVASSTFGASVRFVVSPGHEADGYMHMPGGQSGNPASENYKDQHNSWAKGIPAPFLPGEIKATITLTPAP